MDENLKKRYMAESKFLRAYFYFDLVRFFKNIPLFKEPISASEMYNVVQADPSEVYSLIIPDLQDAIADLPPTVPVETEGGRATEGAARALLGKVYLQLEDYILAAEQFKEVNGEPGETSKFGYSLLPNFNDLWDFDNKQNPESIFSVNHSILLWKENQYDIHYCLWDPHWLRYQRHHCDTPSLNSMPEKSQ